MKKYILLILAGLVMFSCARVGSPSGGKKDSLAPKLVGSNIDSARINVPVGTDHIRLDFDEYVTLKDVQKNLIISPPIKYTKIIPTTLGNKFVEIRWDEPLQENTTYNFNFGNAIADLNEGNVLPYFNFAFSTGNKLDNLYISGDLYDGFYKRKEKTDTKTNYVVGLYKASDSIDYTKKPYYITRADTDGYFELNYLSPGHYRIIGFNDEDQNSVYTPGKESVYFQDKDVVLNDQNISGMEMKLLPSRKVVKFSEAQITPGGFTLLFEGTPEKVTATAESENLKEYRLTHRKYSDSARIWFEPAQLALKDNQSVNIKVSYIADTLKGNTSVYYKAPEKNDFEISNAVGGLLPPNSELVIQSNRPLQNFQPDKWSLKVDSTNIQTFHALIDPADSTRIRVKSEFLPGKKYELTVPKETISSLFEKLPKSYQFNFDIDKAQNYGKLTLNLKNVPQAEFWVQLMSEDDKVKYSVKTSKKDIVFSELKPGRYYVRILVDNNGNGVWDPADFKNNRQAEDVYIFDKIIEIRQMWENVENTWDPLHPEPVKKPAPADGKSSAPTSAAGKELPKPSGKK
ncbi:Ig-like domain-containing domain [Weeksellaceae bacterium A-14]